MRLGIYLPTYHRPHKLQEVASNIEQATTGDFKLYFGVELKDVESFKAAKATGHAVVFNKYSPRAGHANTIQSIYEESDEEIFFCANDDFYFPEGWNEGPLLFLAEHPEVLVLGVQDGLTPSYSTIFFVRRNYIEEFSGVVDMPRRVLYPYNHNYQDTEFTYTAQSRGIWAKLEQPCIKHNRVGGDETYAKNEATSSKDAQTFESRKHLWENDKLRGEIMPRGPLSPEEKEEATTRMKKYWAEKKAREAEEAAAAEAETELKKAPTQGDIEAVMFYVDEALKALAPLKNRNMDVVECAQMFDALQEAKNRGGQVQGLLNS